MSSRSSSISHKSDSFEDAESELPPAIITGKRNQKKERESLQELLPKTPMDIIMDRVADRLKDIEIDDITYNVYPFFCKQKEYIRQT